MAKKKQFTVDYNRIEKQIWALAEPLAAGLGLELVDVEYLKEAGNWYLRIYIDREPPVDHDCCQALSELISAALDHGDPIEQSYFLEVSSPGLNRPLKRESDFARFAGREVCLTLYAPWEGQKQYKGILRGLSGEAVMIERDGATLLVPRDQVARARLAID